VKRARRMSLPQGRAYGDSHRTSKWASWLVFSQVVGIVAAGAAVLYILLRIFSSLEPQYSSQYDALAATALTVGLAVLGVGKVAGAILESREEKRPWGHDPRALESSASRPETDTGAEKPRAKRKPKYRRQL